MMVSAEIQKFILPVRADIQREIKKRSKVTSKNGVKQRSSDFGWGVVDDTIPTVKKDLEEVRKRFSAIIQQVRFAENYLEQEPPKKRVTYQKTPVTIVVPPHPPGGNTTKQMIPSLLDGWRMDCQQNITNGSIGLVPECYQDGVPPMDDFVESNTGQVVLNVLQYIKKLL